MAAIKPAEPADRTNQGLTSYGKYIVLPTAILVLSVALAAFFYRLLPPEVAYRFEGGAPSGWMNRSAIIAWLIIPQFVLVFVGVIISGGTSLLSARFQAENPLLRKLFLIMGNMVALPQVILTFAMLDIFLYNAYRIHLMPLWAFVLIVIVFGSIILGIFFVQLLRQLRKLPGNSTRE